MVGSLLLRGMMIGVIAGLLAFCFARFVGEPFVDRAIAFEEQTAAAAGEPAEPETVSRSTQAGFGLLTGVVVYGAAIGGLFSLAFALGYGRITSLSVRSLSAAMAAAGFIALVIVPALKYPPNPPAVGVAETIAARTELYFAMLVISIVALGAAVALARRLMPMLGARNAAFVAGAAFIVIIAIVQLAAPTIDEVPEAFSASLLWSFRAASIAMQAILWAVIGIGFGWSAERLFAARPIVHSPATAG